MAAGASYPAVIVNVNGDETQGVTLEFTDEDNQPGGAVPEPPFHAAETGVTAVIVDSPDGDPIIDYDASTQTIENWYKTDFHDHDLNSVGALNAQKIGASVGAVLLQADPPDPIDTYLDTQLVYDSTAVTGGLYGWDGTQYRKIGNLVT